MKVYKKIEDIVPLQNAVVATGTFDGIHKGHQFIISRVKQRALELNGQSAIITFNNHPQIVLNPTEKELFILNTETEKIQLLEKMGYCLSKRILVFCIRVCRKANILKLLANKLIT